jgi:3-oxoacyl-[acyl-carrier protein] reductase
MKLKNKVAVITGAGKGIGKATASVFLKEGAKLVLVSRTKKDLDQINKEWKNYKEQFITVCCDVSKEASIKKIVDATIKKFKRIDILVNNAGFGIFAELVKSRLEDFDAMFNTNVRALYLLTKAFLPYMIKQKSGDIINIASIAGKNGVATGSIYSATKHAVMGLTRSLMLEVRKYNIRATSICPGSVDTEFFRQDGIGFKKETALQSENIAEAILLAVSLPKNALIHEIELRPANPQT